MEEGLRLAKGGRLYEESSPDPAVPARVGGGRKPLDARELTSTILELAGIGFVSAGLWLVAPWCGLVALGLCLILLGVANSRTWDGKAG